MSCSDRIVLFFFFKQKTAYEMRISDWSSDVCSSDLSRRDAVARPRLGRRDDIPVRARPAPCRGRGRTSRQGRSLSLLSDARRACRDARRGAGKAPALPRPQPVARPRRRRRSEEHTSELQSLMRISYAVFCLKKKHTKTTKKNIVSNYT